MNCSNDTTEVKLENIVPPCISEKAASKIIEKFDQYEQKKGKKPLGIRINVARDGCAGMSYGMEYVFEINGEHYIDTNGVKAFMDDDTLKMLSEATIDYHETESASGFVFNNPNEQCKCACGKSFCA
ncbi:iron-sulfur cluster assembly accessory protein [Candidatus Cytomitobacter indipagum]|uniref:Iron-sulfur cluster assembly accessory protein n=1 Tax=Candidatus Cytomitobacter indipagum TaxID=2601575 RepID=A0A5C0UDV6_9PROT|nr:iron-sulfur cluster assembly accessory protein [Candidatus Cytomitobacter indipagum]QEK37823.1 iron-sulfur cluster assembly accessory protein [Candidatus Cytomitobacter indipagum]